MTTAPEPTERRLTITWIVASVLTIASGVLAATEVGSSPRTGIAVAGLLLGSVKVHLVVQNFMEVRTAPRWLKLFTGVWLVVLSATILGLYLAA